MNLMKLSKISNSNQIRISKGEDIIKSTRSGIRSETRKLNRMNNYGMPTNGKKIDNKKY